MGLELQKETIDISAEPSGKAEIEEIAMWGHGVNISVLVAGKTVGSAYVHFLHSDALTVPLGILLANMQIHWEYKEKVETALIKKVIDITRRESCSLLVCVNPDPRDTDGQKNVRRLRKKLKRFGFIENGPELLFDLHNHRQ